MLLAPFLYIDLSKNYLRNDRIVEWSISIEDNASTTNEMKTSKSSDLKLIVKEAVSVCLTL